MDSASHKAFHVDEYIPRDDKVSPSRPTSSFGIAAAMYNNNNEGRQNGNSMYVMVPVPVPMGGQQQPNGGFGWNGPSYGGPSDWDHGHTSSSRSALMPRRSTHPYPGYYGRRHRKNCCSCWRCAVASVIILAFIGVGTAVAGIVFLKMMRENADAAVVVGGAGNGTRLRGSSENGDRTSFDITLVAPADTKVIVAPGTTNTSEAQREIALALDEFVNDNRTGTAADVDLLAGGNSTSIGILLPPNSNVTVNVTSDASATNGQTGVGVGPLPLPVTARSVGSRSTGIVGFVQGPRRSSYDVDLSSTPSSSIHQMPSTPVSGPGFIVNDPEADGASAAHLFTTSPGPAHLIVVGLENVTMTSNGTIDVPNPVSAVTHNPSEARNTTFIGAKAWHFAQPLNTTGPLLTSSPKPR